MIQNEDLEDRYPFIIHDLMRYIEITKKSHNNKDLSLLDIIMEYSDKNNLSVELVGDAISSDVYLKSFIEKDCEFHNIIKSDKSMNDW